MKNINRKPLIRIVWTLSLFLLLLAWSDMTWAQEGQQRQIREITGTLVNSQGEAIPGARVLYQNGTQTVTTDEQGAFSLQTISDDVLVIKTRHYQTRYVKLKEADLSKPIQLSEQPLFMKQENRVVLPYGELAGRRVTGAVSGVKGEELNSYSTINVANSLSGKIAGFYVSRDNGRPGWSEPNLYLRGLHSNGGNAPVVYVDGIEREISDLNSEEIESIHFMKDVTAKILAGPKAINGLLWVETKRGKPYQREIDINVEYGTRMPTAIPEYLGSYEYAQLYNEARVNDGMSPFYSQEDLNGYQNHSDPVLYPDNDLYGDFLSEQMPFTHISSQISGGDDQTQYFINLSYMNSGGLEQIGPQTNYDKFKARANLDVALTDVTTMHLDINGRLEFREWNNLSPQDFFGMLSSHRPNEYPYFITEDPDSAKFGASHQYYSNIYGEATRTGYRKDFNRMGQANFGLDFDLTTYMEGLTAEAYMMFDSYNYLRYNKSGDYNAYIPYRNQDSLALQQVRIQQDLSSQSHHADDVYRRLGTYGKLNYQNTFSGQHQLQADLLARYNQTELKNNDQDPKNTVLALRTNYMLKEKYILEADVAYYGSPRFREGERYSLYPAFGAGWVLSEESFLKNSNWVDFLKVKGSWGIMGTTHNFTSYYSYRDVWNRSGGYSFGTGNGNNVSQVVNSNVGNPGIGWEESREFNLGVKGLFFSERLLAEVNYFNELRSGILTQLTGYYPGITGNWLPYENYEEIANQGLEASLSYTDQVGDFTYSVGVNGSFTQSEYQVVNEPDFPEPYMSQEGQPVDAQFGLVDRGFFTDQEQIDNAPDQMFGQVHPGDIQYQDLNEDGVIDREDIKMIGGWFPDLTYGLHLTLNYKGFELYVSGAGVQGLDAVVNDKYNWVNGEDKYPAYIKDARWTPETAESATFPRLTTKEGANNFRNSSFWVQNRDYFKIRNVELSYSLPRQFISHIELQEARIFLRGVNVLTFSSMERMDPESPTAGINNWPLFSTYTAGVKLSF